MSEPVSHGLEMAVAEVDSFHDLIGKVRSGDPRAAERLVRQYEPAVRRAVRIWMLNAKLRRSIDSIDICQSVLASFFVRTALSQYQIDTPAQLVNLLVSMARNKLTDHIRQETADRRDIRRVESADVGEHEPAGRDDSPSQVVVAKDLVDQFRVRMTAEERQLADLRAQGKEWSEIAELLGSRPDALRKKLDRALNRIARELGLDNFDDE